MLLGHWQEQHGTGRGLWFGKYVNDWSRQSSKIFKQKQEKRSGRICKTKISHCKPQKAVKSKTLLPPVYISHTVILLLNQICNNLTYMVWSRPAVRYVGKNKQSPTLLQNRLLQQHWHWHALEAFKTLSARLHKTASFCTTSSFGLEDEQWLFKRSSPDNQWGVQDMNGPWRAYKDELNSHR